MYIKSNIKLNPGAVYVDAAGTQYPPASWQSRLAELGIEQVADPIRPDDTWYIVTDNADGSYGSILRPSVDIKVTAKAQIKSIRNAALAKFVANAGVAGVYDVNYNAAVAYEAGNTTLVLRNGRASGEHCGEFGTLLGMAAAQFAAYIIAENRQTVPTKRCAVLMHEIEAEYLRLYYSAVAAMTDLNTIAAPAAYQTFCDARNP